VSPARASRLRAGLTVAQAALSALLLVGAGLFVRSLAHARGTQLGLDAERVLYVSADVNGVGFTKARVNEFWRQARDRVAALPGVESASLSVVAPFVSTWSEDVFVPGLDSIPDAPGGTPNLNAVTPEYLRTLGTPIRRGRGLRESDVKGSAPIVVVNEAMARSLWPGRDAIGRCFKFGADTSPCMEVVGIAADSRNGNLADKPARQYFLPLAQLPPVRSLNLFVRTTDPDARSMVVPVRRALQALDPGIPFPRVEPIQSLIDPQLRPWRLGATLFTAFGLLALVVASVGLYGVLAYDVASRTRELGVRAALGARTRDVAWLVLRRGLTVTAVGIAIGLAGAAIASRWVADLLFGVPARDPATLGTVAALLLLVAFAASLVPAWRAARVNPQVALRAE
jgi:putative ABC transport system permease protein